MKEVHVLTADDRYYDSGSIGIVAVFTDKAQADEVARLLNVAVETRGKEPERDDSNPRDPFSYAARDAWRAALNAKLDAIQPGASNCEVEHVGYEVDTYPLIQKAGS